MLHCIIKFKKIIIKQKMFCIVLLYLSKNVLNCIIE